MYPGTVLIAWERLVQQDLVTAIETSGTSGVTLCVHKQSAVAPVIDRVSDRLLAITDGQSIEWRSC